MGESQGETVRGNALMCLWLSPTPGHRNIRVYCIVDVPPRYFTVFHFLYCVRLRAREYCRGGDQLRKSVIVFDFLRFIFFRPFQSYCDTASSKIQYCSHPIFHYWPVIRSCQQILLNRSNIVMRGSNIVMRGSDIERKSVIVEVSPSLTSPPFPASPLHDSR